MIKISTEAHRIINKQMREISEAQAKLGNISVIEAFTKGYMLGAYHCQDMHDNLKKKAIK